MEIVTCQDTAGINPLLSTWKSCGLAHESEGVALSLSKWLPRTEAGNSFPRRSPPTDVTAWARSVLEDVQGLIVRTLTMEKVEI